MSRFRDGSAGDVNYGTIGRVYSRYRQPDPRIAKHIRDALGNARTVLNVGAGAGSYEPRDLDVTPVEPSETMRAQRPPFLSPAVDAVVEHLPFPDASFDAAMGTFTVHQWSDLEAGCAELRRITRGPIVILTADPDDLHRFWLNAYLPEVLDIEQSRYPRIDDLCELLGSPVTVTSVPIPLDCTDGFTEAYFGRPERFLEQEARKANSAWGFVPDPAIERFLSHLGDDLTSGAWDREYGHLRTTSEYHGSLRLIVRAGLSPTNV